VTSFFTYVGLALGLLGSTLALPFGLYVLIVQREPEKFIRDQVSLSICSQVVALLAQPRLSRERAAVACCVLLLWPVRCIALLRRAQVSQKQPLSQALFWASQQTRAFVSAAPSACRIRLSGALNMRQVTPPGEARQMAAALVVLAAILVLLPMAPETADSSMPDMFL
jgi:hypothetical protein